jgi:peptidylprolyl isomerase
MGADFKMFVLCTLGFLAIPALAAKPADMSQILAASTAADWRPVEPENTLYIELATGRVVIELAPGFAPLHVANIKKLARTHYFDGIGVVRVQDNYVVQWANPQERHPLPAGMDKTPPEFDLQTPSGPSGMPGGAPFTRLPDGDVYAPEVGFSNGLPVARAPALHRVWLAHCYGMVGVGRDLAADSGSGAELYMVLGHAPRHLDRNVALVGRVLKGAELLSGLPRGGGDMGFYTKAQTALRINAIRVAADMPQSERSELEVLRTDTKTFANLIESRRNRPEEFFKLQAGRIDLCNVPIPVRDRPAH